MENITIKRFYAEYCAPDLLDLDGKMPSIRCRIVLSFKEALKTLSIPSKTINQFYQSVSLIHTKRHFRVALKFVILLSLYLITVGIYSGTSNSFILVTSGMFSACSIIVYLLSFRLITSEYYRYLSQILTITFIATFIHRNKYIKCKSECEFTPTSQIFFLMYAVLPIKLEHTLSIGCLYTSADLSFLYFRVNDLLKSNENINEPQSDDNYVTALVCMWVALHTLGIYIHFCNQFRRRASFLRLGENVKSQIKNNLAFESQMKCIEAIMPVSFKNKYWEQRKNSEVDDFWVFTKTYRTVSILFADIIGFTKFSSNKTAAKVVSLLNDIFNRFDDECNLNNCEKVGTIGDCYYCVAGCPVPRSDHAVCCVELGLSMCRIIKTIKWEYNEEMNMRIGVHSGRVNAAIIGKLRFRFDVFSSDVFIANETESKGKSGRVHITETTFKLVKLSYTVEESKGLFIKKEVDQGLAGKKLIDTYIKTYFVVESDSIPLDRCLLKSNSEWSSYRNSQDDIDTDETTKDVLLDEDLNDNQKFIKTLTNDPNQTIKLFGRLPICNLTMQFIDEEIELDYINHINNEVGPVTIDSVKIAPFLDSIMAMIYSFFLLIAAMILFVNNLFSFQVIFAIFLYFVGIGITILNGWKSLHCSPKLKGKSLTFFNVISKISIQNILQMYMACLSLLISLLFYDHESFYTDYIYTMAYFSLLFFSLLNLILFTPPSTLLKAGTLCMILVLLVLRIVILQPPTYINVLNAFCEENHCSKDKQENSVQTFSLKMALQISLTCFLVIYLDRENQKNLRLCFYIKREVQRRSDAAKKSAIEAKNMLHNIIPKYVLDFIEMKGGNITSGNCYYAKCINNVGIGFACISNFFSNYYREDYQAGRGALRLLNKIICIFDELIQTARFSDLEKIKTINDCYMFAAGLNIKKVSKNSDQSKHLQAFVNFSLEMKEKLDEFNEEYIFGTEKFQLKSGLNCGTVTAGVIGITKPFFDVWGDTVNVASRMCSTAVGNEIQVTENLYYALSNYFSFKQKGIWNIKGKGKMKIFICEGLHHATPTDIMNLFKI